MLTTDEARLRLCHNHGLQCQRHASRPRRLHHHSSSAYRPVIENGVVCVNVTGDNHKPVCQHFGGKAPAAEWFALGNWTRIETVAPVLEVALATAALPKSIRAVAAVC